MINIYWLDALHMFKEQSSKKDRQSLPFLYSQSSSERDQQWQNWFLLPRYCFHSDSMSHFKCKAPALLLGQACWSGSLFSYIRSHVLLSWVLLEMLQDPEPAANPNENTPAPVYANCLCQTPTAQYSFSGKVIRSWPLWALLTLFQAL